MNNFLKILIKMIVVYLLIGIVICLIGLKNHEPILNNLLFWPVGILKDLKNFLDLITLSISFSSK